MLRKIKARWQAWLDGAEYVPAEPEKADPLASSALDRPNPYKELAASNGQVIVRVPGAVPTAPVVRAYEDDLPDWARAMLDEMDRTVGVVVRDEITEVRTPQYVRRHRRNLAETIGSDPELLSDGDEEAVPTVVARILDRARRASDPEITGMISVITDDMGEEVYA